MNKARKLDQRLLLGVVIIALVAVVGIINPKFITLNNVIAILADFRAGRF
jgi:ribose/xylose/arabinose/galactoside ABC-type transport system permease subunit